MGETRIRSMRDAQKRGTFENLGKARDEQLARQGRGERLDKVLKGADGVRKMWANMTPEERSERARRAA